MKKLLLLLIALLCASTAARAADSVPNCRNMKRDITALSCTIYYEARGEPIRNMVAVSFITLNRVKKRNKSVVKIVKEKGQYTYLKRKDLTPKELQAWALSKEIATYMLNLYNRPEIYAELDFTHGATMYHDTSIPKPTNWKGVTRTLSAGKHVFYKEQD